MDATFWETVAGQIAMSSDPGMLMRKWRETLSVTQAKLAATISVTPSVVADYEAGRRSPGTQFLRKYVLALRQLDLDSGGALQQTWSPAKLDELGILEIREYLEPLTIEAYLEGADATRLAGPSGGLIHGHTRIDAVLAISKLQAHDFGRLYGWNVDRALIFKGVTHGRSPMIALRVHPVKPKLVLYEDHAVVDSLACRLAESIGVTLAKVRSEKLQPFLDAIR